jgi:hypothetical protein
VQNRYKRVKMILRVGVGPQLSLTNNKSERQFLSFPNFNLGNLEFRFHITIHIHTYKILPAPDTIYYPITPNPVFQVQRT